MTQSTLAFVLGASAVGLGVVAAIISSPVVGVIAALVAAVAWYFDHREGATKEAALEERGLKAEREVLELRKRLADRKLSEDQNTRLLNRLKAAEGHPVDVITEMNEPESKRFASALIKVFDEAGWRADLFITSGTQLKDGVGIATPTGSRDQPPCAAQLWTALDEIGITAEMWKGDPTRPEGVQLLVGRKPH